MKGKIIINLILYIILTSFFIYIWVNEKKLGDKIRKNRDKFSEYLIKILNIEKNSIKKTIKKIVNTSETIITAVILVLIIQYFYIGNFMVPTGSMMPTIMLKERFFGDMVSYRFRMPKRGEIIVFKEPIRNKDLYTKRLVGLPGEEIKILENGNLIVNNEVIKGKLWEDKLYANAGYLIHGKKINSYYENNSIFYSDLGNLFRMDDSGIHSDDNENEYVDFNKRLFIDNKVYYYDKPFKINEGNPYYILNLPNNMSLKMVYEDLFPILFLNGVPVEINPNNEDFTINNIDNIFIEEYNKDTKFKLSKNGKLYSENNVVNRVQRRYTSIGFIGENTWYIPKKGDELTIIGKLNAGSGFDTEVNVEKLQNILSEKPELVMNIIPNLKFFVNDKETGPILDILKNKEVIENLNAKGSATIILNDNYYMALGDNTNNSFDSRFWGMINEKRLRGRTIIRFWPLNKIGIVR